MIKDILNKSYYKIRIIITFSFVTVLLVVVMSVVSYQFIKNLYLEELTDHVNTVSQLLSKQIDDAYLTLLHFGAPIETTENYFKEIFNRNISNGITQEIFVFDDKLNVIVHLRPDVGYGKQESRLLIYRKEIDDLQIHQSTATMPFKGDDGNWYLWGFYRLDQKYFLAFRESASRLQRVENFAVIFWYFGLGFTLLTIICGWIIASSITRPINKLVRFSQEIGKGNQSAKTPEEIKGEIGILSQAMGNMQKELIGSQNEREKILAQIAHEIRNPLGGIELLANLTKEDLKAEGRSVEYIENILKEVSGLKTLITAYLDYSKPVLPKPGWIDLSNLLKEIENVFKKEIKIKNAKLESNLQLKKIFFDSDHLKQILINLVANSLESISKNGKISLQSQTNGRYWKISVSDNGAGIPEENLETIFNPFFTTKKDGTGLGLAICKKLCTENKADLIIENNSNKGCTFTLIKEIINES